MEKLYIIYTTEWSIWCIHRCICIELFMLLAVIILLTCVVTLGQGASSLDKRLAQLCQDGDLYALLRYFKRAPKNDASTLFGLSALNWILYSDVHEAVRLHKEAKSLGSSTVPPLANIYLQGNPCGGMSDLFYVSAVTMKQLVDSNIDEKALKEALTTLITLTSDTGLPFAAEAHMQHALSLFPQDTAFRIRSALMTPGVYENISHIHSTRSILENRAQWLRDHLSILSPLSTLDEFVLSPTFYYIYQGFNDRQLLKTIHHTYATTYPPLAYIHDTVPTMFPVPTTTKTKLRIGFVSAYFRHHSVCKLFCGVIQDLARYHHDTFDVFVYSSLAANKEDTVTQELRTTDHLRFISTGRLLLSNRHLVTDQAIDILVYLDMGMDPAGIVWAAARLATVQMCLWGHPSTTALPHMDYYLSSERFHVRNTIANALYTTSEDQSNLSVESQLYTKDQDSHAHRFEEQLIQFDGLGIAFARPILSTLYTHASALAKENNNLQDDIYLQLLSDNGDITTLDSLHTSLPPSTSMTPTQQQINHLLNVKRQSPHRRIILCPQFAPKLHPLFDDILVQLLSTPLQDTSVESTLDGDTSSTPPPPLLILLSTKKKRLPWQTTIAKRLHRTWTRSLTDNITITTINNPAKVVHQWMTDRIMWMEDMSPQEYLQVLYLGDVMLDPFPFGGGVTVLESLSVCTPVVTAPSIQTVPQLAAGILDTLLSSRGHRDTTTPPLPSSPNEYTAQVRQITANREALIQWRRDICTTSNQLFHADKKAHDTLATHFDASVEYAQVFENMIRHLQM